uniref:Transmembrane protein 128 n=1 Tax=Arion vulgaris TaxID=1028688 RepID=A0A0B6Y7G8_9EUPU
MASCEIDADVVRRRFQQKLSDHYANDLEDAIELNKEKSEESTAKKSPFCIQNFMWLGASIVAIYFSDFINVIVYDQRIKSAWYWTGVLSLGLHIGIAIFLVVWLTFWKNVSSDEWEQRYPSAVPVATASLIIAIICLCIGLWPVWGFLTPIILLILLMGTVVVIAMVG